MCKDARKYDAVQCRSHPALRLQSDIKEEHEKRTRSPNSSTHTRPEANLTRETKTGEEIEMDKAFSRLSVYDSTLTATRLSNEVSRKSKWFCQWTVRQGHDKTGKVPESCQ